MRSSRPTANEPSEPLAELGVAPGASDAQTNNSEHQVIPGKAQRAGSRARVAVLIGAGR